MKDVMKKDETKKERIVSFDAFRFILALCVVWGHTFLTLFRQNKTELFCIQNLAVDGFFILSGFLMALSYSQYQSTDEDVDVSFIRFVFHKVKRLWAEYIFALILYLSILGIWRHYHTQDIFLNAIFLGGINKVPDIIIGAWYVSVLFWTSCIYSALLFYKKKIAIYILIPLISFFSFTFMYTKWTGLSLNSKPLIDDTFSAGFLKGFLGLGIGISLFFICERIKKSFCFLRYPKTIFSILEITSIYLLIFCFFSRKLFQREYIIYMIYPIILSILYFKKEFFLKFFSWKLWFPVAPTAYMLYLTHCILLEIIKKYISYKNYSETVVYVMVMIFCVVFAYICYHVQKWLFAKLKQILFIPQSSQTTENLRGTALAESNQTMVQSEKSSVL